MSLSRKHGLNEKHNSAVNLGLIMSEITKKNLGGSGEIYQSLKYYLKRAETSRSANSLNRAIGFTSAIKMGTANLF